MNTPSRVASILQFLGMHQRQQTIIPSTSGSVIAREICNARPYGGSLQSVLGSSFHSAINYKAMKYISTLIEYTRSGASPQLIATGWDTIFKYDSATWTPLGKMVQPPATGSLTTRSNNLLPSSLNSFTERNTTPATHYSWLNSRFDHFVFNDKLYLCDGINRGMKYDSLTGNFGLWGIPKLSYAGSPIRATVQDAAGTLDAATYKYTTTLYDNTNSLEGMPATTELSQASAGAQKFWIYVDLFPAGINFLSTGNYDFHNQFTDYVRIYRNEKPSALPTPKDDKYLVASLKIWKAYGTCTIAAGVMTVVTQDALFTTAGVVSSDAVYITVGLSPYQAGAVIGASVLTLLDPDGTAYTGADYDAAHAVPFYIVGGYIDNQNDLSTPLVSRGDRLFTEDTTLSAEQIDHSAPVKPKYATVFGDQGFRVFYTIDGQPNRVYYSQEEYPDYCPTENYLLVSPDDGDIITGLVNYRGKLLIFKTKSVSIAEVQGDVFQWSVTPKYLPVGALRQDLITDCNGMLIWVSETGVFGLDAAGLHWLSHQEGKSNWIDWWKRVATADDAVAVYDKTLNEYNLFVSFSYGSFSHNSGLSNPDVVNESTTPVGAGGGIEPQANGCMVYNLTNGQWFQKDVGATAACVYDGSLLRSVGGNIFYEEVSNRRTPKSPSSVDYDAATDIITSVSSIGGALPINKLTVLGTFTANEFSGGKMYITERASGTVHEYTVAKMDSVAGVTTVYVVGNLSVAITQYDYVAFRAGGVGSVGGTDTTAIHGAPPLYLEDSSFTFTAAMVGKTITWHDVSTLTTANVVITSVSGHKAYGAFANSPVLGDSWAIVETDADAKIRFNWSTFELALEAVPFDKKIDGVGVRGKGYADVTFGFSLGSYGGSMIIPLSFSTGFILDDIVKGVLDNVTYKLAVEAETVYREDNTPPNAGRLATLSLSGEVSDQVTIYEIELYYRINAGHKWS